MDNADDGNQNPGGLYGEIIQAGQKSEQLFCIWKPNLYIS